LRVCAAGRTTGAGHRHPARCPSLQGVDLRYASWRCRGRESEQPLEIVKILRTPGSFQIVHLQRRGAHETGSTPVGPVYKRAIFLRRDGATSPETVDSELSSYVERVAREVDGISDRVMLYTMKGLPYNWPTPSYPAHTDVKRMYDAVIMIWPKKDRIIPSYFYGVPENYRVLHALDLAGYYYVAPAK